MRTGYDVEKTEYEMVKRTQKVLNTVNQLSFTCEKFSHGLRGPRRCEYFLPRTSCNCMIVITRQVWIRLECKH